MHPNETNNPQGTPQPMRVEPNFSPATPVAPSADGYAAAGRALEQEALSPEEPVASASQPAPVQPAPHAEQYYQQAYQQTYNAAPPTVPPTGGHSYPQSAPTPPKKSNGGTVALIVLAVLLCCGLLIAIISAVASGVSGNWEKIEPSQNMSVIEKNDKDSIFEGLVNQDEDQNLANAVAEAAMPSVVSIYTFASPSAQYSDMLDLLLGSRENMDATSQEPVMAGLGSGVILNEDGYIITNNHVVAGADSLMVNVGDESFDGEVVGTDPESDLAVVKIDAGDTKLVPIELGDSDALKIGDWVMAIGSPLGYEQTATTGIVSALGRDSVMPSETDGAITIYANMIQTDAAINGGNSGGALVDDEARLIGINTLVAANDQGGQADNLGFAIPANYAVDIANQIIDNGKASHAKLGVSLQEDENGEGAVVAAVVPDSAAAKAGLAQGDIITAVNGKKVSSPEDVVYDVRALAPGSEAEITYTHNGQEQKTKIVLGSDEEDQAEQPVGKQLNRR